MRKSFFNLILLLALVQTGCSSDATPLPAASPAGNKLEGGIAVGNSMSVYTSREGYSFKYNSQLALEEPSAELVVVDTKPLETKPKNSSRLEIRVLQSAASLPRRITSVSHLREIAHNLGADSITQVQTSEADTLSFKLEEGDIHSDFHLILARSGLVLQVEEKVHQNGDAKELIEEAQTSIELDMVGPEISEIKILSDGYMAGENLEIEYVATDDKSAINPFPVFIFEHEVFGLEWIVGFANEAKEVAENRYRVEIQIPDLQRKGRYVLREIRLSDSSRNLRSYHFHPEGHWRTGRLVLSEELSTEETLAYTQEFYNVDLGYHQFSVVNLGAQDREFPKLISARIENPRVQAGDELVVLIQAEDDESGIDPNLVTVNFVGDDSFYRLEDFPSDRVEQRANGEYAVIFKLGRGFWPGRHTITEVTVGDRSGKIVAYNLQGNEGQVGLTFYQSRLRDSVFFSTEEIHDDLLNHEFHFERSFEVINDSEIDEEPPFLKTATIDQSRLKDESIIEIYLELQNDSELFTNGLVFLFESMEAAPLDDGLIFSFLQFKPEVEALGDRKYVYRFQVPDSLPAGRYRSEAIFITDQSGNFESYWLLDGDQLNEVFDSLFDITTHVRRDLERPSISTYWGGEGYIDEEGVIHSHIDTGIEALVFEIKK